MGWMTKHWVIMSWIWYDYHGGMEVARRAEGSRAARRGAAGPTHQEPLVPGQHSACLSRCQRSRGHAEGRATLLQAEGVRARGLGVVACTCSSRPQGAVSGRTPASAPPAALRLPLCSTARAGWLHPPGRPGSGPPAHPPAAARAVPLRAHGVQHRLRGQHHYTLRDALLQAGCRTNAGGNVTAVNVMRCNAGAANVGLTVRCRTRSAVLQQHCTRAVSSAWLVT